MSRSTPESPTREGLLARRAVVMAELGMLDAEFDDHCGAFVHTETHWASFEEFEQLNVLLEADTWFSRDEIDAGATRITPRARLNIA
jgi:hypothetical protein